MLFHFFLLPLVGVDLLDDRFRVVLVGHDEIELPVFLKEPYVDLFLLFFDEVEQVLSRLPFLRVDCQHFLDDAFPARPLVPEDQVDLLLPVDQFVDMVKIEIRDLGFLCSHEFFFGYQMQDQ